MRAILGGMLLALTLSGAAFAQTNPEDAPLPVAVSLMRVDGAYSFRDDDGRALYFFDRDTAGHSNCEGQCAAAWPPVAAPADAHQIGDWTPVRRSDGSNQWAYRGKPVYRFARDADGQAAGASVPGWRVAVP